MVVVSFKIPHKLIDNDSIVTLLILLLPFLWNRLFFVEVLLSDLFSRLDRLAWRPSYVLGPPVAAAACVWIERRRDPKRP